MVRMFALFSAAAALATNLFSPAGAEQRADVPQIWQVDWENSHCTISTGDPANAFLSLWMTPGDPSPDLYIVAPADKLRTTAKKGTVILGPGGKSFTAFLIRRSGTAGSQVLEFFDLKEKFPAAFSESSEVTASSLKTPVTVPVKGAAKAMAALRQCIDEKLTEWGIDAKVYESLRSPPIDPGHLDWFTSDDYPSDAMQAGFEGDVVARVDVDAAGKVSACSVLVGSGMDSIDKVTCARVLQKGRFIPAIGPDGKPTAAVRTIFVKFNLEG